MFVTTDQMVSGVKHEVNYRMAGNFGGEFILADWRF